MKTVSKKVSQSKFDALDVLRSDHMKAEAILVELRLIKNVEHRKRLFNELRTLLNQHLELEENFFYPACARIQGLKNLIYHAMTDHQLVKAVLKDLAIIDPGTKRYESLILKLTIELERHVIEEENKIFPRVRKHMDARDFGAMSQTMLEERIGLRNRKLRRAA